MNSKYKLMNGLDTFFTTLSKIIKRNEKALFSLIFKIFYSLFFYLLNYNNEFLDCWICKLIFSWNERLLFLQEVSPDPDATMTSSPSSVLSSSSWTEYNLESNSVASWWTSFLEIWILFFLHYIQRWAKDYLRRRLDWVIEDLYGRSEYTSNTSPRHLRSALCPCQYIEEHLRNKRLRESLNPCAVSSNPCHWCD